MPMAKQSTMENRQIQRIIEAALLAAIQPLPIAQLLGLFADHEQVDVDAIGAAIEGLRADADSRGIELAEVASGFRFQIAADVHPYIARLWTERPTRYSRALLETLALIAYRQPITRAEIEQIRGVTVASSIMRTLEEREWARVVGHRDVPGRPALFGTTRMFLDYFGLKSLDELPPLAAIRDLADIEPQLALAVDELTAAMPIPASIEHQPATDARDAGDDADLDAGDVAPAELEHEHEHTSEADVDADIDANNAADDADSAANDAAQAEPTSAADDADQTIAEPQPPVEADHLQTLNDTSPRTAQ